MFILFLFFIFSYIDASQRAYDTELYAKSIIKTWCKNTNEFDTQDLVNNICPNVLSLIIETANKCEKCVTKKIDISIQCSPDVIFNRLSLKCLVTYQSCNDSQVWANWTVRPLDTFKDNSDILRFICNCINKD